MNTTTAECYNISKGGQIEPEKMPENRKDAGIYIRKLHEMLPELKEKYYVSYLGVFESYVRGEQKPGSDLDVLVEFSRPPQFLICQP